MNCNHKIIKISKGDKRNPYKSDNYICSKCKKEFRKV